MRSNPMSHPGYKTRCHASYSSARLITVHGELVKIDQAVVGVAWTRGDGISFHCDRSVTNSLNCVTP